MAGYDLKRDRLYGHIVTRKDRIAFLAFYLRSMYPPACRSASCWTTSHPHKTTNADQRVRDWTDANNVDLAYTPNYASWLNRIEAQLTALRRFTLDNTDHPTHRVQASPIGRYVARRNHHAEDEQLTQIVTRANVA